MGFVQTGISQNVLEISILKYCVLTFLGSSFAYTSCLLIIQTFYLQPDLYTHSAFALALSLNLIIWKRVIHYGTVKVPSNNP